MDNGRKLTNDQKLAISKERFEQGISNGDLARKYGVCTRTIIRTSNEYREKGDKAFNKKEKKPKKEESIEEKVTRLEKENELLRVLQKELLPYAKKK